MAFTKETIKDIDLKNKTVLVRMDYNVPLEGDTPTDLYRVKASIPTLEYLLQQNCKIILISHLGRPEGKLDPKLSLKPLAKELSKMINQPVEFADDCVGPAVSTKVESLKPNEILLLENLRFHPEEESNDSEFAKQLAGLADVFVQDGFGVVHRAHASTDAVTEFLPSVAGLLVEKEVDTITEAMENPKRPFVAIVGGAKVSDKIEFLQRITERADKVLVGGAMGNTFMRENGQPIGKSVYEQGQSAAVAGFENFKSKIVTPQKVSVGPSLDAEAPRIDKDISKVADDDYILDDDFSDQFREIAGAGTIIWNGPIGMTEYKNFKQGSLALADTIINSGAISVVGGGDTVAFLEHEKLVDKFSWVSTGGGASLELMAGKKLPGVEALLDK